MTIMDPNRITHVGTWIGQVRMGTQRNSTDHDVTAKQIDEGNSVPKVNTHLTSEPLWC